MGGSGQISSDGSSTIDLRFGIRENETGLSVKGINNTNGLDENDTNIPVGIDKDGWDYLWIFYGLGEDSGRVTNQPRAAYVERILERTDLASLFT
jgi:hypothetical protein